MKKTFKEKYLELRKEKDYLQFILDCKCEEYDNLKNEFNQFKFDLDKKQQISDKMSFIFNIICFSFISLFLLLGIILKSIGCF